MMRAKDQNIRRQAAAYIATLALQGDDGVPLAVVDAYRFDSRATALPWDGGPLFIPSLQWDKRHSQALVGNLVAWLLWCDLQGRRDARQPIINNLSSFQLMQAAGYQWPSESTVYGWLQSWGQVVGRQGIEKLLAEQGVDKHKRFEPVLDALE